MFLEAEATKQQQDKNTLLGSKQCSESFCHVLTLIFEHTQLILSMEVNEEKRI